VWMQRPVYRVQDAIRHRCMRTRRRRIPFNTPTSVGAAPLACPYVFSSSRSSFILHRFSLSPPLPLSLSAAYGVPAGARAGTVLLMISVASISGVAPPPLNTGSLPSQRWSCW